MPLPEALKNAPSRFRAGIARGLKAEQAVDRKGGDNGVGIIRGAAVLSRGEAQGHGLWCDKEFLRQTADAINESPTGLKSRFTHPSSSGDGMGTQLGRVKNATVDGDTVRADLHFAEHAHDTPDGDLAGYVLNLAEQDPDTFGLSIAFSHDKGAENLHFNNFSNASGAFESPDPANTDNLPHIRLHKLRATDVVDEPAANPSGLFHGNSGALAAEAEGLLLYSLGLSPDAPSLVHFDLDPDRASSFVARCLDRHNLVVTRKGATMPKQTTLNDTPPAESEKPEDAKPEEKPTPDTKPDEKPADEKPATDPPAETPPAENLSAADARSEVKRYLGAFGAVGATWFAEGIPFEAAKDRHIVALSATIEDLEKRLSSIDLGDDEGAEFQAADDDGKKAAVEKYSDALGENTGRVAAFFEKHFSRN